MRLKDRFKTTPLWLVLPSVALAGTVGVAVGAYEPLVFDASLYDTPTAEATELKRVNAEELEKKADVKVDAKAAGVDASAALADGTWTGYAACGEGNEDNWKPYYVAVTIEVKGGKVAGITKIAGSSTGEAGSPALNWDAAENQAYLDWAIDGRNGATGVKAQIEAGTSGGVDTVSGATYSSVAIYNAYADALNKAAAAAGNTAPQTPATAVKKASTPAKKKKVKADTNVGALADGTWTGYAACGEGNPDEWKPYYVAVTVEVKDGKVARVGEIAGSSTGDDGSPALNWDAAENQAYLDWAVDGRTKGGTFYTGVRAQIEAALAKGGNPATVDTVSGATYSSTSVFDAYYAALRKSAAAAGSSIEEPETPPTVEGGEEPGDAPAPDLPDISLPTTYIPDGLYSGYAFCEDEDDPSAYAPYYIWVVVEAAGGSITSITDIYGDAEGTVDAAYRYDAVENHYYLDRAINGFGLRTKGVQKQIQAKLDAGEEVTGIDTVSGATWSSRSIITAFANAVAGAIEGVTGTGGATGEDEGAASAGDDAEAPEGQAGA